ncbi:MAG: CAP domain-containing protein, partial [Patescibacteria group bacterium]
MAKILTYNSPSDIESKAVRKKFFRSFWESLQSLDRPGKFFLITALLIIVATPVIVSQYLDLRQNADVQGEVQLINNYRQSLGIQPLIEDQILITLACWKAEDMATNNYFSHTNLNGQSMFPMMHSLGMSNEESLGEIIGKYAPNSEIILQAWKNSPGHNAIITNPKYTRIGIGWAKSASGAPYWVGEFASGDQVAVTDWKCNDKPISANPAITPVFSDPIT